MDSSKKEHNRSRLDEAFQGFLGDQESKDIREECYHRYVDVCHKHGDTSCLAFPPFVDAVAFLPYVHYENDTGDVHFLKRINRPTET